MPRVESFDLDHDEVRAPYVRRVGGVKIGRDDGDCEISKFDLRFTNPNSSYLPMDAMHSLEHLLATFIREYTDDLIDISPMGCRTGFYAIFGGYKTPTEVATVLRKSLKDVLTANEVPGATKKSCGNYLAHDLEGAKEVVKKFLAVDPSKLTDITCEK